MKERREPPNQKTNSPIIRSAKNYTHTKKQKNKRTDRALGQIVKAKLYRQKSHKEEYTYTVTKREKGKHIFF